MKALLSRWLRGERGDRNYKRKSGRQFRPAPETLESRLAPTIRTWTGLGTDDLWSNAANWDTGVPGNNDDVRIAATTESAEVLFDSSVPGGGVTLHSLTSDGTNAVSEPFRITGGTLTLGGAGSFALNAGLEVDAGTLSAASPVSVSTLIIVNGTADVNAAATIGALTMGSPGGASATLTGSGDVTVNGLLTLITGTMTGSGTTFANGGISFQIGAGNGFTLDGHRLDNAANQTAVWTGLSFAFTNGAVFNNNGIFDVQCDQNISAGAGGGTFSNNANAIFRKSAGSGNTTIGPTFNNAGTVDLQTGTTNFIGGGTSTGPWTIAAPATLQFGGGTFNLNAGSTVTGTAGAALFTSGTVNLGNTYNVGATTILDGTVNFNAAATTGTLSMGNAGGAGALLDGSADVTINGLFTWSSGTMTGFGKTFANGGINFSPGGGGGVQLDGRQLDNASNQTATWTSSGSFVFINGAVFNNNGIFDDQVGGTLFGSGSGTTAFFNNIGTFKKSAGNDAAVSSSGQHLTFNNTGTVEARSGSLDLHKVAQFDSATSTLTGGTWKVFANAALTLQDGFSFTNNATIVLDGPNSNLNNTILANSGSFTIQNGRNFNPSAAFAFNNSGVVNIGPNSTFTLTNGGTSTGDWDIADTGTLRMATGAYFFDGGTDVTGTGILIVADVGSGTAPTLNVGDSIADVVNVSNLRIGGGFRQGTVTAIGTLHVSGPLDMGANNGQGILNGTGEVTVGGMSSVSNGIMSGSGTTSANGGMLIQNMTLRDGRQLVNNGPATWTAGGINFKNGAVFTNTSTFDIQADVNMTTQNEAGDAANAIINTNTGIFKKTAGDGSNTVCTILVPFNNNGGTVDMQTGPIFFRAAGSSTGPWTVAASAAVSFFNDIWNFNAGTVSGAGTVNFSGGTVHLNDTYSVSTTRVQGGIANFNATSSTSSLTVSNGTLGGVGDLTVNGLLTWIGGTIAGAGTAFAKGDITLSGGTLLTGRTLDLAANHTLTWLNGSVGFAMSNGAVFNNHGTFDAQNDVSINNSGGAQSVFINNGTFKRTAGTVTNILVAFTNNGTIDVQTGTVSLNGPTGGLTNFPTASTAPISGSPAGATEFGNTVTITIPDSGHAFVVVGQQVTISGVTEAGYNGTFIVTAVPSQTQFQYTAPTSGLPNSSNGSASFLSTQTLTGGTYLISGALKFTDANIVTNAANIVLNGPNSKFLNESTNTNALANFATNAAGGSFTLQNGRIFTSTGAFSNAGNVTVGDGSTFSTSTGNYAQTGGTTMVQGTLDPAGIADIQGGTLAGNGTVQADTVNAGLVAPGTSPGILTIDGDYTQTAAGALNVEIGGTAAGQFDQLVVSGQANLDGTVNISLTGGFTPGAPDSFRIVSAGSRSGAFATINGLFNGGRFVVLYDATGVILDVNVNPTAGNDSDTTLEDNAVTTNVVNNDSDGDGDTFTIVAVGVSAQGVAPVNNGDGTISYTPPLNFNGSDSYTYTIRDAVGNEATGTVTIDIIPVNDAPTVVTPIADLTVDEGASPALDYADLASVFADVDNVSSELTYVVTANTPGGIVTATIDAENKLDLVFDANASGVVNVTVRATDPDGLLAEDTFQVTVRTINHQPTLDPIPDPPDILVGAGEQTINLTGISAGAGETQFLSISAASDNPSLIPDPAVHYTSPNAAGSLTFVPVAGQVGTAIITVTLSDDGGTENGGVDTIVRTFAVHVNTGINAAPTIDPIDSITIAEDPGLQTVNMTGISAGIGESQIITIKATSDNHSVIPDPTVIYTSPNATGALAFTPVANQFGTATITVTVMDNNGTANGGVDTTVRTFTVTVTDVNDAPTAGIDNKSTVEDTALTFAAGDLLANDSPGLSDESGQSLSVTAVSSTSAHGGTVQLSGGSITYTPPADYDGPDSFTYTVTDDGTSNGVSDPRSATGTVNVVVTEVNDAPSAGADTKIAAEDTALSFAAGDLTANDSAGPGTEGGQTLTVAAVSALSAHGGTVVLDGGTITYTPPTNYSGPDSFTYTVSDNGTTNGAADPLSATGSVNLTVTEVNDAPTAGTDGKNTAEDSALSFTAGDLTANDSAGPSDESGQSLTVTAVSATSAHGGTVVLGGGTITYTPPANYNGPDSFTYTVTDNGTSNGVADPLSATGTVNITIAEVNDAPSAGSDSKNTAEDTALSFTAADLTGNDSAGPSDERGQSLTVTGVSATSAHGGTVVLSGGTITYTPPANFNGPDSFTYTVTDNGTTNGAAEPRSATGTVNLTVMDVNDAPTAGTDSKSTAEDTALSFSASGLTINDSAGPTNENSQTLRVTAVSATSAQGGAVTLSAGQITYTPPPNYNGPDSFTYTVTDNGTTNGAADPRSATGTVNLTVTEVNDAPTPGIDGKNTAEDTPLSFSAADLTTNDSPGPSDESGQNLTVTAVSSTSAHGGTVTLINGTIKYTPPANFNGPDSFTYTVTDDGTTNGSVDPRSAVGTVNVTVSAVNDAPTLVPIPDPAPIPLNAGLQTIGLTGISAGPSESQILTVKAVSSNPTLIPDPQVDYTSPNATGTLSYQPVAGQSGSAIITVTVTDDGGTAGGGSNTVTQTFSVTVTSAQVAVHRLAVGAAAGHEPRINVLDSHGQKIASFLAYRRGFTGGVRVAVGDVNGDGIPDIITGGGSGGTAAVEIINGAKLSLLSDRGPIPAAALLGSFFAFAPSFAGGVHVAAGDVNGDGHADIIVSMGGAEPRVKVIDGTKLGNVDDARKIAAGALLGNFLAYPASFQGGVTVAAGDVNGNGHADIIVGPASGPRRVKVIDGNRLKSTDSSGMIAPANLLAGFFAFRPGFEGGVFVASGDVNGDGKADLITGAGPRVKVIDSAKLGDRLSDGRIAVTSLLANEHVFASSFGGGVQVGAADLDGDGLAEVLAGAGPTKRRLLSLDVVGHRVALDLALAFDADSVAGS